MPSSGSSPDLEVVVGQSLAAVTASLFEALHDADPGLADRFMEAIVRAHGLMVLQGSYSAAEYVACVIRALRKKREWLAEA